MSAHPEADLGVYVLGVLPGPEETRLRLHLETCASCRVRVDELEGIGELLSAARLVPDPPAGLVESALASLPPRRPRAEDGAAPAARGDFVVTPPERAKRRQGVVAAVAGVVVVVVAALTWALLASGGDRTVQLVAGDATARGVVRVGHGGAGTMLALHATGLAAADYEAELDGRPAGSFRVTDGAATVDLHASAASGHFTVRRQPDGAVVLEADLG